MRDPREIKWLCLGLISLAPFVWGILEPEGARWGFHALAYFPASVQVVTVVFVFLLLVISAGGFLVPFRLPSRLPRQSPWIEILIGSAACFAFYSFPIQGHVYGDSKNMLKWYADNHRFDPQWAMRLLEPNPFTSKEALTVLLHRSTAYLFSMPIQQSYHILSALFGGLFVTLWLLHVRGRALESGSSLILILAGLFSGSNAVFFGEVESYAFAALSWSVFFAAAALYFDGRLRWFWVILLFVVAVRGHAAGISFLPAVIFLLLYQFRDAWRGGRWFTRPAGVMLGVVIPFLAAGLAFYIRLGSYKEPYAGLSERHFHRLFLPVVPAAPPLDRYTLQSPNHLIDLVNVAAQVTLPASMLLLGCILWHRRAIRWSDPKALFFLIALLFSGCFYFAVNPVLTMPRDWDLFAPLAIPALFLLSAILPPQMPRTAIALTAGLGVFSIFFFLLNANAQRSSYRVVDAGRYAYGTYHRGSGYFIRLGLGLETDPRRFAERMRENQRRLKSMAFPGDEEFVIETCHLAAMEVKLGRAAVAEKLVREAAEVAPQSETAHGFLADFALVPERVPEATREVDILMKLRPDWVGTRSRAVRLALLTGDRESAFSHLAVLDSLDKDQTLTPQLREKVRNRWPGTPP